MPGCLWSFVKTKTGGAALSFNQFTKRESLEALAYY